MSKRKPPDVTQGYVDPVVKDIRDALRLLTEVDPVILADLELNVRQRENPTVPFAVALRSLLYDTLQAALNTNRCTVSATHSASIIKAMAKRKAVPHGA